MNNIPIKNIGSFFETDKNGYIINPTDINKIQPEYKDILNDIVELYKTRFGEKLHTVYVRGSVAKGTALSKISDIDTWCIVDDVTENISTQWSSLKQKLFQKYPEFDDIEMGETPLNNMGQNYKVLLHQSLCIYGNAIIVPRKKINSQMAIHAPNFRKRFDRLEEIVKKDSSPENIQKKCVWLMKSFLRIGLELTLDRAGKYSRDLHPCYEIFAEYYPEKELEMKKALNWALNPTQNITELLDFKNDFGNWLLSQAQNQEWKKYE